MASRVAPGLSERGAVQYLERRHGAEPIALARFVVAQPGPGLQPALAAEREAHGLNRTGHGQAIQVDRHQLADRGAVVAPLAEGLLPAHHQQAAAAVADEPLDQRLLVGGEEGRLQVVEHQRVVTEQDLGHAREPLAQLLGVAGAQPDQHRFVVPFGLLALVPEAAIERVGGFARGGS